MGRAALLSSGICAGCVDVIIECSSCQARYQYAESRFEGKPSKKIRCAKCQTVFEIRNPAGTQDEGVEEVAVSDETVTKRTLAFGRRTPDVVAAEAMMPEGKRYSLAVLDGAGAGTVMRIDRPSVTLGRSDSDIVINDTEASRNHARLELRAGSVWLEDLGSTNGTFFAGERLGKAVELQNHSEFQVGGTTLMLIVTETD